MTVLDTVRRSIAGRLSDQQKRALKSRLAGAKKFFVRSFLSYDAGQLHRRLAAAGIAPSDTVMVHVNFEPDSGFRGDPADLVNALVSYFGDQGNLLMVSIPFRGTAYDYLVANKPFNVKKTISMMGLVTEMFRRREGTLRSLHPTHPVLAAGKDAAWITAEHDKCLFPCGAGSPFDRFRQLKGKILFFDVDFGAITFYHHVEDVLKDRLPFRVYDDRMFTATVIDVRGESRTMQTYTFNKEIPRNARALEEEMRRRGEVTSGRVGNSRFLLVTAEDVVSSFAAMVDAKRYPYDWRGTT